MDQAIPHGANVLPGDRGGATATCWRNAFCGLTNNFEIPDDRILRFEVHEKLRVGESPDIGLDSANCLQNVTEQCRFLPISHRRGFCGYFRQSLEF